jgi:hypothetical protein
MCTLVILRRPGHEWPVLLAANRDEMAGRPWQPPARHWPERPRVTAGLDEQAGGTWLGLNTSGVAAGVLNRLHSLGPRPGYPSRGELPLKALDHATAAAAAEAVSRIEPISYRSFNMIIADASEAFWLKFPGTDSAGTTIEAAELADGLSMITAYDLNDPASPRMQKYLPQFQAARPPDPGSGDWSSWRALLARGDFDAGAGPGGAMCVGADSGFGTTSSSLIALPAPRMAGVKPVWLFAAGRPGQAAWLPVPL